MALIFADGFEHYGTGSTGRDNMLKGQWSYMGTSSLASFTPTTTIARTGTMCLGGTPIIAESRVSLRENKTIIGVGLGWYMENLPDTNFNHGIALRDATNTTIMSIVPSSDGSIILKRGSVSGGTTLAISDAFLTAGTFHHVEFKATIDSVVGTCEVRVNGIIALSISNIDLGNVPVASVAIVKPNTTPFLLGFDDFIIWDDTGDFNNDFMGPVRIITTFADGDGIHNDWSTTGSTNGFECIDEVPPDGDTSYIASSSVGNKSSFTMPELPPETEVIKGVFIPAMGRIDEAGVGAIKISMISGSDEVAGSEINLTPGYSYSRNIFEIDPATGAAWTKSNLEAAEVAVEKAV